MLIAKSVMMIESGIEIEMIMVDLKFCKKMNRIITARISPCQADLIRVLIVSRIESYDHSHHIDLIVIQAHEIRVLDYRISGIAVISRMNELTYLVKDYRDLQEQSVTASESAYLPCLIEKLQGCLLDIFDVLLTRTVTFSNMS